MKSSTLTGLLYTGSACTLTTLAIAIGNGRLSPSFAHPLGEGGAFISLLSFSALLLYKAHTAFTDDSPEEDDRHLGV